MPWQGLDMKWSYKTIYYEPDYEQYSAEEKVMITGADLTRELNKIFEPPEIERDLNAMGQDGWELVAFAPKNGAIWIAIFKRPQGQ